MHPILEAASSDLGVELPNLRAAAELTAEKRHDAKAAAKDYLAGKHLSKSSDLDIVTFGSIARDEMAAGSDFDYLIIAERYSEEPGDFVRFKKAAIAAREAISAAKPGSSGIFGVVVGGTELVNSIGLDNDTNLSHTRRILVLEESVSLLDEDRHRRLKRSITARYLHDQLARPAGVPRFLLNDVIRYWRTVAVDYQAKRWQEVRGEKWGLRLLKLRSTRKLTFAGTLVSLLLPSLRGETPEPDRLVEQWEMPPLARLAQLHPLLGGRGREHLREILELADQFTGWLARDDIRNAAEAIDHLREAEVGTELHDVHIATQLLNRALTSLFFCDEEIEGCPIDGGLQALARQHLVF